MPPASPDGFKPGFRFSAFDALLLLAGAVGSRLAWSHVWWLGFVVAFVVGHFFLFCNVFRIARNLELLWATAFVGLTCSTLASGRPGWMSTILVSLTVTFVVIGIELRKPSYHGTGWSFINPNLREWWKSANAPQSSSTD